VLQRKTRGRAEFTNGARLRSPPEGSPRKASGREHQHQESGLQHPGSLGDMGAIASIKAGDRQS
jgi:hypothetical protein